MKVLLSLLVCCLAVLSSAQDLPLVPEKIPPFSRGPLPAPPLAHSVPDDLQTVEATVIRYNRALMPVTAQADLIVRAKADGRYLRLVYCPMDCGFDAPVAEAGAVPPLRMTRDGSLAWTYAVYTPRTAWEKNACASIQHSAAEIGKHRYVLWIDPRGYVYLPGQGAVETPILSLLPCRVIATWAAAGGTTDPNRALSAP